MEKSQELRGRWGNFGVAEETLETLEQLKENWGKLKEHQGSWGNFEDVGELRGSWGTFVVVEGT